MGLERVGVPDHGSELEADERPAVLPEHAPSVKDGPFRAELDHQAHEEEKWKQENEQSAGRHHIDESLGQKLPPRSLGGRQDPTDRLGVFLSCPSLAASGGEDVFGSVVSDPPDSPSRRPAGADHQVQKVIGGRAAHDQLFDPTRADDYPDLILEIGRWSLEKSGNLSPSRISTEERPCSLCPGSRDQIDHRPSLPSALITDFLARILEDFFARSFSAWTLRPRSCMRSAALIPSARNWPTVNREYLWSTIWRRNFGGTVTMCAPASAASWTFIVSRMLPTI